MDYHNIVIAIDWNSNSYYAMTANVKLTDNSFDKYIANTDARKVDWNHPELLSYYENIPAPQRGKIMTSKKRGTDFLNKRGMIYRFSSLVAIVSQKFIDVMSVR